MQNLCGKFFPSEAQIGQNRNKRILLLKNESGMADARTITMITTALLAFLGLSTCATLTIVAAVVLGARRSQIACSPSASDAAEALAASRAEGFLPAFN